MVLTEKQRRDLEIAIFEYFKQQNYTLSKESFQKESIAGLSNNHVDVNGDTKTSHLEKKWNSLSIQQRKLLELEAKVQKLQEELDGYKSGDVYKKQKQEQRGALFPTKPFKFELTGHRDTVTCVAFHPKYSIMASASEDSSIRLWDIESGEQEKSLRGHTASVNHVSFDADGKWLASCSADLSIRVWDLNTGTSFKVLNGHEHNVSCVEFLPIGDKLVSSSRDKSIKMWDVTTGLCTKSFFGHENWVKKVVPNHDGTLIASCSTDNTIRIWNVATGQSISILRAHTHVVEFVTFAPIPENETETKQFLLSGSRDNSVIVWELGNSTPISTLRGHDNWVRDGVILSGGKYAITCSDDHSMKIWDLSAGCCIKTIQDAHSHFVTCLRVNKRVPIVATGGVDRTVRLWQCT